MANADSPFGFRPIRHRNGAHYNGATNPYFIKDTSNQALFIGDPVIWNGTANTARVTSGTASYEIATLPEIVRATAGTTNKILGAIVSFDADPTALENQFRLNATERVAQVCDDPDVIYEIQADSATDLGAVSVGANADFVLTHGGSTVTGLSGAELDGSQVAQTAAHQLIIMRAINRADNDPTLTHSNWEVMISNHSFITGMNAANEGALGV